MRLDRVDFVLRDFTDDIGAIRVFNAAYDAPSAMLGWRILGEQLNLGVKIFQVVVDHECWHTGPPDEDKGVHRSKYSGLPSDRRQRKSAPDWM